MILIDTCVLIWLADEDARLGSSARELIRETRNVFVSAVSAFEIALKYSKGGLALPCPPFEYYSNALRSQELTELPLTGLLAAEAACLPSIHRDPADRFIVATALKHNLPVITPDKFIPQYPGVKVVW